MDEAGKDQSLTISLTLGENGKTLTADSGRKYDLSTKGEASVADLAKVYLSELNQSGLADSFKISTNGSNQFVFEAKEAGTGTDRILSTQEKTNVSGALETPAAVNTAITTTPVDAYQTIDTTKAVDGTDFKYGGGDAENPEDYIIEVNGKKFMLADAAGEKALKGTEFDDVIVADTAANLANKISTATGINAAETSSGSGKITLKPGVSSMGTGTGGMQLQIGANEGQTMNFTINDMGSKALGVDGGKIDLSSVSKAEGSLDILDSAIKKVSEERGKLGAIQNRLEHTIANLDNTAENLQTAESNIRDTDMASEMVNYSKNNIRECFFIHAQIWSVHVGTG
jgi:flagellin